jgi:AcrR family transcriptional regulator
MAPQMRTEALDRGRDSTTRERILAAASDLFSRLGFEATTVKDIARECQLTDPALYYHFSSKRDILTALLVEPTVASLELRSRATPTPEALADDICHIFDFWSGHASLLRLAFRHALDGDEAIAAFAQRINASYEALVMPPLREIYGAAAERTYGVLTTLLTGIQLDALIAHGDQYGAVVATPDFRARLHRLVREALPPVQFAPEAV